MHRLKLKIQRQPFRRQGGQSLVEFSLIMPLVMLLVVNAVNWGAFIFAWITVANASRTAAQYAIMGSASVGTPRPAAGSVISGLVTADFATLVNSGTLTCPATTSNKLCVVVCSTSNTTATPTHTQVWPATGTLCTTAPADPVGLGNYKLISVDVSYFYTPPIALFKFPGIGINLTLGTQTLHRQAQMRHL